MAIIPTSLVIQSEIESKVTKIARELAPDVVRIRFNIGEDWIGDPAIFFRILLSDHASKESRLSKVTRRIETAILERLNLPDSLHSYFDFRSKSEQAELKDKSWA